MKRIEKEMTLNEFIQEMKGGWGWARPWEPRQIGLILEETFKDFNTNQKVVVEYITYYDDRYIFVWRIIGIPYAKVKEINPYIRDWIDIWPTGEGSGFKIVCRYP